MIKTAIITFHAAHNYGSMLQAFALQNAIVGLGYENDIIDFRTRRQKDLYTVFTKRRGIKYLVKNLAHLLWYFPLKKQYDRFEFFLTHYLKRTRVEYNSLTQLEEADLDYDVYIAGSDQIWNPVPADFDWAYYLPFISNVKKISYAASFGQLASKGDIETRKQIGKYIKDFNAIGVREQRAKENVRVLSGRDAELLLDPTLLLPAETWKKLLPINNTEEDYIFFYTLFAEPEYITIVDDIAKHTGLKVVISNFSNQYDIFNHYEKRYDTGPVEFLKLVNGAKLVITTSYHGTVFSILFNKPFLAINGLSDARICTLLEMTSLKERAVSIDNISERLVTLYDVHFEKANCAIEEERGKSLKWLKEKIGIE